MVLPQKDTKFNKGMPTEKYPSKIKPDQKTSLVFEGRYTSRKHVFTSLRLYFAREYNLTPYF